MNNEKLENLRQNYLKTSVPSYLKLHGWDDLSQKLNGQEEKRLFILPIVPIALAAIVLMVFSSTLVFASQPSKPGDNLYQVKVFSDKIYSEITGDYQTAIDKRANEIIELKDEPNGRFDQATQEYQQALDAAKDKTKGSDENKKEELRQQLDEQERKFQEISRENNKNQKKLQDVADQTRKTRGEVKGDRDKQVNPDSEDKDKNETDNEDHNDNNDHNQDD